ncbi:MAG: CHASE domain-containing protein [FCB group bacterium]|jgi:PAS domain S-box-containing protein
MANYQDTQASTYESILKQAGEFKKFSHRLSKTYPAYLILLIMLVVSFFVWRIVDQKVTNDKQSTFEKATGSVLSRLDLKIQNNYQILSSMRGLYDNMVQVVRDYFTLYGSVPVKTYPSITSLMYVPKIEQSYLAEHIHFTQSQGLYTYKVFPPGTRDYYYPAAFIVPAEKNQHISGFDFTTNPVTNQTIEISRDNQKMVSTPFFNFRGDTLEFMLMSPIFKENKFDGVVLIEINAKLFFEEALGKGIPSDTSILFRCFDTDFNNKENQVYTSRNYAAFGSNYKPDLQSVVKFNIADRTLIIKFQTNPDFGGKFQETLPILSLIISLVLSFSFFGFILSTTSGRARAIDLAERMTRSQRRIVESSKDIIAMLDLHGIWKSMNVASIGIFGYQPDEMIGNKIDLIFENESEIPLFYSMFNQVTGESTERVDIRMKTKDNNSKWLNWSFTISQSDALIYAIGRDVTLEKLSEEQTKLKTKQIQLAEQFTREANDSKTYFITRISHQIRNALTGIMGYLQMLSAKQYSNDEEHDSYIELAEQSSDDLFSYTSDILEVAQNQNQGKELSRVSIQTVLLDADKIIKDSILDIKTINLNIQGNIQEISAITDKTLLTNTLVIIFKTFSEGNAINDFQISASESPLEKITEISIISNSNNLVSKMIQIFNDNKSRIIDILKEDVDDILQNIAIVESNFRMLNGTLQVATLGAEEGNIIQISLPLKETQYN